MRTSSEAEKFRGGKEGKGIAISSPYYIIQEVQCNALEVGDVENLLFKSQSEDLKS